jgi:hypothetical protein
MSRVVLAIVLGVFSIGAFAEGQPMAKHVKVYYEEGRFGGWPANHGLWSWDNEILVGFSRGSYKDLGPERHNIDREKPEEHLLARSLDGGETWSIEDPAKKGYLIPQGEALHGTELPGVKIPDAVDCPGGIDFTHRDFAMTLRMSSADKGASRFYYSYDRGKNWQGPFKVPMMGTPGIMARTSYIVDDKDSCTVFLTAAKSNREEGRPFCARILEGGRTWEFVSWIGPEPKGYAIMPSAVRLSDKDLFVVVRCRDDKRAWLSAYASDDNGKTWKPRPEPISDMGEGNPGSLVKLRDGRLCLTYGYRAKPYGICAKIGSDAGNAWGKEIALRNDGAGRDIGYTMSLQRPDGKMITLYYFHDNATGPERYVAATIWDLGK